MTRNFEEELRRANVEIDLYANDIVPKLRAERDIVQAECERLREIEAAAQRVDILLWDMALKSFPDHRAAIAELSDALALPGRQPNGIGKAETK